MSGQVWPLVVQIRARPLRAFPIPAPPPTNLFTNSVPKNQEMGVFYVVQECRATDFEAQNFERVGRAALN